MSEYAKSLDELAAVVRQVVSPALDDPEMLEALEQYGFDRRTLETMLDRHGVIEDELTDADDHDVAESADPVEAVVDHRAIVAAYESRRELTRWIAHFRATARVAFHDKPEWLERMGIGKALPRR